MKWFKCSERLPKAEGDYIVWHSQFGVAFAIFHKGSWSITAKENVTHWMYKPNKPKEQ